MADWMTELDDTFSHGTLDTILDIDDAEMADKTPCYCTLFGGHKAARWTSKIVGLYV
jgi:hypothetical protein